MPTLTFHQKKELAQDLEMGFRCFWNKETHEILSFPNPLLMPDANMEDWSEQTEAFESSPFDYLEIEPLQPSDSFDIMEAFAEALHNRNPLKSKLQQALSRKHPFREFKFVIDNAGEFREMWFAFKDKKLQQWVQEKLDRLL